MAQYRSITKEQFRDLFNQLLRNHELRDRFFLEPQEIFIDLCGIRLSSDEAEFIKSLAVVMPSRQSKKFNDKLVLCSSSGY